MLLGTLVLADAYLHHWHQLALLEATFGLLGQCCGRLRGGRRSSRGGRHCRSCSTRHPPQDGAVLPHHRGQLLHLVLAAQVPGTQLAAPRPSAGQPAGDRSQEKSFPPFAVGCAVSCGFLLNAPDHVGEVLFCSQCVHSSVSSFRTSPVPLMMTWAVSTREPASRPPHASVAPAPPLSGSCF